MKGRDMKTRTKLAVAAAAIIGVSLAGYMVSVGRAASTSPQLASDKSADRVAALEQELSKIKNQASEKEEADDRLGQYIVNMMYMDQKTVKELSPGAMQMMARNIVLDTNQVMRDEKAGRVDVALQQIFIGAVQLESGFMRFAQSPTGPKGLSQTTKSTFHAALKFCGINDVHDSDVWDQDLSIIAGACYFKWLYVSYRDGYFVDKEGKATDRKICPDNPANPILKDMCAGQAASVAYNQGENSQAIKDFLKSGILRQPEPALYNGKIIFNWTHTPDVPMVGGLNVKDLPTAKPAKVKVTAKGPKKPGR